MRSGHRALRAGIDRTRQRIGIAAGFGRGVLNLIVQLLQSEPYAGHALKPLRRIADVLDGMGTRNHIRVLAGDVHRFHNESQAFVAQFGEPLTLGRREVDQKRSAVAAKQSYAEIFTSLSIRDLKEAAGVRGGRGTLWRK